jgi:hypothetical protein
MFVVLKPIEKEGGEKPHLPLFLIGILSALYCCQTILLPRKNEIVIS